MNTDFSKFHEILPRRRNAAISVFQNFERHAHDYLHASVVYLCCLQRFGCNFLELLLSRELLIFRQCLRCLRCSFCSFAFHVRRFAMSFVVIRVFVFAIVRLVVFVRLACALSALRRFQVIGCLFVGRFVVWLVRLLVGWFGPLVCPHFSLFVCLIVCSVVRFCRVGSFGSLFVRGVVMLWRASCCCGS